MTDTAPPTERRTRKLTVIGEVDLAVVDDLVAAAQGYLDEAPELLQIDLAAVTFIDSSGLGALVRIRNEAVAQGCEIVLMDLAPSVLRVFEVSGLEKVFEVRPDE